MRPRDHTPVGHRQHDGHPTSPYDVHHDGGRRRPPFLPGHPHRGPGGGDHRGAPFGFGFGPGFRPGHGGFGPGRGGRGRARRGDVRLAILSLLSAGPSNGYGLIKGIAERSEGTWRPSPGSVYPTLQQLVDEDLIVADEFGSKTVYALSETGTAYVTENAEAIDAAWAQGCYKIMLMAGSKDLATLRFYTSAGFEQSNAGFQIRREPDAAT